MSREKKNCKKGEKVYILKVECKHGIKLASHKGYLFDCGSPFVDIFILNPERDRFTWVLWCPGVFFKLKAKDVMDRLR